MSSRRGVLIGAAAGAALLVIVALVLTIEGGRDGDSHAPSPGAGEAVDTSRVEIWEGGPLGDVERQNLGEASEPCEGHLDLVDDAGGGDLEGWARLRLRYPKKGKIIWEVRRLQVPAGGIDLTVPAGLVEILAGAPGYEPGLEERRVEPGADPFDVRIGLHRMPAPGTIRIGVVDQEGAPVLAPGRVVVSWSSRGDSVLERAIETQQWALATQEIPPVIQFDPDSVPDQTVDRSGPEYAELYFRWKRSDLMRRDPISDWETAYTTLSARLIDGRAEVSKVPPAEGYVVFAQAEGYAQAFAIDIDVKAGQTTDVELTLSRAYRLRGRVRLLSTPCRVKLNIWQGDAGGALCLETDAEGRFDIALPRKNGSEAIFVAFSDRDPLTGVQGVCYSECLELDLDELSGELDIVLGRGKPTDVTVLDPQGQPVEGAFVYMGNYGPYGRTDSHGRLLLYGDLDVARRDAPYFEVQYRSAEDKLKVKRIKGFEFKEGSKVVVTLDEMPGRRQD